MWGPRIRTGWKTSHTHGLGADRWMSPSEPFQVAETSGLVEDSGEEGEVVGGVHDDGGHDGVHGEADEAEHYADQPDEQQRSPGVGDLRGVHEGEGEAGEEDGDGDSDPFGRGLRDDVAVGKPAEGVEEAGEQESAEGQFFKERRGGEAEDEHEPGSGGGLHHVLGDGRIFGHGQIIAHQSYERADGQAEDDETKKAGPLAPCGAVVPMDAFVEGLVPHHGKNRDGDERDDSIGDGLNGNTEARVGGGFAEEPLESVVRKQVAELKNEDACQLDEAQQHQRDDDEQDRVAEVRDAARMDFFRRGGNAEDVGLRAGFWRARTASACQGALGSGVMLG